MEHEFELPVAINGEDVLLPGRLVTTTYAYKMYIMVDGQELVFERDDEQQFRIISESGDVSVKREVLKAIVEALEGLSK